MKRFRQDYFQRCRYRKLRLLCLLTVLHLAQITCLDYGFPLLVFQQRRQDGDGGKESAEQREGILQDHFNRVQRKTS